MVFPLTAHLKLNTMAASDALYKEIRVNLTLWWGFGKYRPGNGTVMEDTLIAADGNVYGYNMSWYRTLGEGLEKSIQQQIDMIQQPVDTIQEEN